MHTRGKCAGLALMSLAVVAGAWAPANAAEYTWNFEVGNGSYNDPANWYPPGGPPGANDTALFEHPHTAYDGHVVNVPHARSVGGVRAVGDTVTFDVPSGALTIGGTSASALSAEASADLPSYVYIRSGSVLVPNGGLRLLDTRAQRSTTGELQVSRGASLSVDRASIMDGGVLVFSGGVFNATHDVEIGDASSPASARQSQPAAQFTAAGTTTIGGAVRVYNDGNLTNLSLGTTTITGPLTSTGRVAGDGRLNMDFTNGGVFAPESMTLDGKYVQTADGVLAVNARNSTGARVVINNPTVQIDGTVLITPLEANRVGQRFFLVDADNIQYTATMVSQNPSFTFAPQVVPGEGLYAVLTGLPEPLSLALLTGAGALLFARRRRK